MPDTQNSRIIAGLMSGTSLDGLDIAICEFASTENFWQYRIIDAVTFDYSDKWMEHLKNAQHLSAVNLLQLHKEYGEYLGSQVVGFLKNKSYKPFLIASHGHTIFHQPQKNFTFQLGDGNSIAALSGITTISDFRSMDVALGGQGAPLVPIGDVLLFGQYDFCLNLGGFANISFQSENKRIAFDICPVNFVLNLLAASKGKEFDHNGNIAASGQIDHNLLSKLNSLGYYKTPHPKSLGREWVEKHVFSVLEGSALNISDKMRTFVEHIAVQCGKIINPVAGPEMKLLITGGGAHNEFLINQIARHSNVKIVVPDKLTIDYKEALIFAFLGLLRSQGKVNCLSSVTGASRDSCGGVISHGINL
jgi:anhydro-N-acetylmuramic acid kinase